MQISGACGWRCLAFSTPMTFPEAAFFLFWLIIWLLTL
jgi:hypothetical protein